MGGAALTNINFFGTILKKTKFPDRVDFYKKICYNKMGGFCYATPRSLYLLLIFIIP